MGSYQKEVLTVNYQNTNYAQFSIIRFYGQFSIIRFHGQRSKQARATGWYGLQHFLFGGNDILNLKMCVLDQERFCVIKNSYKCSLCQEYLFKQAQQGPTNEWPQQGPGPNKAQQMNGPNRARNPTHLMRTGQECNRESFSLDCVRGRLG